MTIATSEFLSRLSESGLLSTDELQTVRDQFAADAAVVDADVFTTELVAGRRLTPYQASRLTNGRPGPLVLGDYEILEPVDECRAGELYKARSRRTQDVAAVEIVPKDAAARDADLAAFRRKIEAFARLDHANIVKVLDCGEANGVRFVVTEYVDGDDLESIVDALGPLAIDDAVDVLRQTARGLEHLHANGFTSNDVRPCRLLLDDEGVVRILSATNARQNRSTTNGVFQDEETADAYGLGCALFFLLTGRRFADAAAETVGDGGGAGDTSQSLLSKLRPDVPDNVDAVYRKLVARPAGDRCSTAAVLHDLEPLPAGQASESRIGSVSAASRTDEQRVVSEPPSIGATSLQKSDETPVTNRSPVWIIVAAVVLLASVVAFLLTNAID